MIVVKLGGSLAESGALKACLDAAERRYRQQGLVVVPGGGAFAEQVRIAQGRWRFDDVTAHAMAVLAMQQTALMCRALNPRLAVAASAHALAARAGRLEAVIWSPRLAELDGAGIRPGWDVTSDSLAAWLARFLSARELMVVKSAEVGDGLGLNLVDQAFAGFIQNAKFRWRIIGKSEFLQD